MKKILTLALSIAFIGVFGQAKISQLPTTATITGSELIPVVQSGVTKQTTAAQLANLAVISGTNYVLNSGNTVSVNLGANSFSVGGSINMGLASGNTSTLTNHRLSTSATAWVDFGDNGGSSFSMWAHRNNSKTSSNYNLFVDELDFILNDSSSVQLRLNNSNAFSVVNPNRLKTNADFSVIYPISFQKKTLQESRAFRLLARTQGFLLGGTLTTQRVALFEATTYTAAVSATLTNPYNGWFSKGIAGSGVSITNNWGIGTDGSALVTESLVVGSSAHTPSANLDVTGTGLFTSTVSIGGVKAAVLSDALFPLQFSNSFFSPADGTTYYLGQMTDVASTNALNSVVYVPYNCTLVGWSFSGRVQSVAATAETSTLSARVNNTTDILLSSSITYSLASGFNNFTGTVSSNISAGDFINIKLLTPTWATNPTNVGTGVTLWFVRRQ